MELLGVLLEAPWKGVCRGEAKKVGATGLEPVTPAL
jgi:hypothetical protein